MAHLGKKARVHILLNCFGHTACEQVYPQQIFVFLSKSTDDVERIRSNEICQLVLSERAQKLPEGHWVQVKVIDLADRP